MYRCPPPGCPPPRNAPPSTFPHPGIPMDVNATGDPPQEVSSNATPKRDVGKQSSMKIHCSEPLDKNRLKTIEPNRGPGRYMDVRFGGLGDSVSWTVPGRRGNTSFIYFHPPPPSFAPSPPPLPAAPTQWISRSTPPWAWASTPVAQAAHLSGTHPFPPSVAISTPSPLPGKHFLAGPRGRHRCLRGDGGSLGRLLYGSGGEFGCLQMKGPPASEVDFHTESHSVFLGDHQRLNPIPTHGRRLLPRLLRGSGRRRIRAAASGGSGPPHPVW